MVARSDHPQAIRKGQVFVVTVSQTGCDKSLLARKESRNRSFIHQMFAEGFPGGSNSSRPWGHIIW